MKKRYNYEKPKDRAMISLPVGRSLQKGGVVIRVIFAVVTLLLIGGCIVFFLQNYQQQLKENHRKAGRISEYGLQTALERLSSDPSWKSGFEKITYDDGWYTVSLRHFNSKDTVLLDMTAEGHMGNASDTRECILSLVIEGNDSIWVQRSLH
jgi:hypothetical protein